MKIDTIHAKYVEVLVDDRNKLWLNIDGQCAVRLGCAENLRIEVAGKLETPAGLVENMSIERHHDY